MNPIEIYLCGNCRENHDTDQEGAKVCCLDENDELYIAWLRRNDIEPIQPTVEPST